MTKQKLVEIATKMIKRDGLINLTRIGVCTEARIPDGTFQHVTGCTFAEFVQELEQMNIKEPTNANVIKSRTFPTLRKRYLIDVAVKLAVKHGYRSITREMIAESAGVSGSLVSQHFTMSSLRENIMEVAVMREIPEIIAQGILDQNILALAVSPNLRKKAAEIIEG